METKKIHIEWIRIIAILLVLLNHSDLYFTFYTNTDNIVTYTVSLLVSSVCKVNVPLFMMITGALVIPKNENFAVILKNRVYRIFIVLLSCSAIMYCLQCFVWNKATFSVIDFIKKFLENDIHTSYWYLYEYIGILLMLPFVAAIVKNLNAETLKILIYGGMLLKVILAFMTSFVNYDFPIDLFVLDDSVFYVTLGYYIENIVTKEKCAKISSIKIKAFIVLGIVLNMIFAVMNYKVYGKYDESILNIMIPFIAAMIYLEIRRSCLTKCNEKTNKYACVLGSCCFGVYLVEYIGQKLFLNVYLWLCEVSFGVLACVGYVSCIAIFSFVVVYLLRKIKIIRQYI